MSKVLVDRKVLDQVKTALERGAIRFEAPSFYTQAIEALRAALEQEPMDDEYEVRADGVRVRKDRWEWGIRRIVALLWGNRKEFEIDGVVEAVRALVPQPFSDGDDEGLLRVALEQPEQEWLTGCPNCGMDGGCDYEALECCKDVPETDCGNMEPVAIVSSVTEPGQYGVKVRWLCGFPQIAMKLYTHSPSRDWRGLTEEDLAELARQEELLLICDDFDALREIARAIEDKLKEKNHE